MIAEEKPLIFFGLEFIPGQCRFQNPELVLGNLESLVILDEIEMITELYCRQECMLMELLGQTHWIWYF
jgi:hypothetical protein